MTLRGNGGAPRISSGAHRTAALASGLALLVAGLAGGLAGCGGPARPAASPAAPTSAPASPAGPAPSAADAGTAVAVHPGELPGGVAASSVPVGLWLPAIGARASVTPVGVSAQTGELDVPPSVTVVGWYRYGPGLDTAAGSTVIAGHVDTREQGEGAFFRLRELRVGDPVEVTGADGRVRRYTVTARTTYPKTSVPLDVLFARDGAPRLTLVTCGGPFDSRARSYRDNVVVTAVPAG